MPTDFKLPALGENITSGDIVSILVSEGDDIQANQGVLEIETGKAVVEVPAPSAGKVAKVYVKKGQTVKVGEPLISLEGKAGAVEDKKAQKPKEAAPAQAAAQAKAEPAARPQPAKPPAKPQAATARPEPARMAEPAARGPAAGSNGGAGRHAPVEEEADEPEQQRLAAPAGPSTRRLARELGVDINHIRGTGPGGRITREDVVASVRNTTSQMPSGGKSSHIGNLPDGVEGRDNWGRTQRAPLTRIRKTIAANMVHSATTIPHVTNFDDADITELERLRKGGMAEYADSGVKLTMMPFVMKAVAQSLRVHPLLNSSLDPQTEEIIYKAYINLGVAVDTDRGLVVPVVRNVDQLRIPEIAQALADVTEKARTAKFTAEDQQGGTFTISNMGTIGGTYSTPIINPPQVAIILVGRSRKLPVAIDDKVEVRLMMPLSISYDHRLVDGAAAARFLNEVKNYLQVPGRLLLAQ
jgi:pyruvate dehydrogenase E2 component (dihydrolipoamide acetyltransferase)